MIGADDSFYWVRFSDDELQKDSFDKTVNTGKSIQSLPLFLDLMRFIYFFSPSVRLDRDDDSNIVAYLEDDEFSYYILKNGNVKGGRIVIE